MTLQLNLNKYYSAMFRELKILNSFIVIVNNLGGIFKILNGINPIAQALKATPLGGGLLG